MWRATLGEGEDGRSWEGAELGALRFKDGAGLALLGTHHLGLQLSIVRRHTRYASLPLPLAPQRTPRSSRSSALIPLVSRRTAQDPSTLAYAACRTSYHSLTYVSTSPSPRSRRSGTSDRASSPLSLSSSTLRACFTGASSVSALAAQWGPAKPIVRSSNAVATPLLADKIKLLHGVARLLRQVRVGVIINATQVVFMLLIAYVLPPTSFLSD